MSRDEIHASDIGTIFRATIKDGAAVVNISAATTKQFVFRKPNGTTATKTASFYTDGTDGIMQYTIVAGDLDVTGIWQLQAYVVLTGGSWYSDLYTFEVYANL